jgi:hypothetical protein
MNEILDYLLLFFFVRFIIKNRDKKCNIIIFLLILSNYNLSLLFFSQAESFNNFEWINYIFDLNSMLSTLSVVDVLIYI